MAWDTSTWLFSPWSLELSLDSIRLRLTWLSLGQVLEAGGNAITVAYLNDTGECTECRSGTFAAI